ncbi:MAG: Nif11-like leader peptide family RiPP precursor [Ignavibacteriales bacterium]
MSASEITRFNKDIVNNQAMMDELKKIGSDVAKIVDFAKSKGYDFSVEDLKAQQGELSDEKLDKVAGGVIVAAALLVG